MNTKLVNIIIFAIVIIALGVTASYVVANVLHVPLEVQDVVTALIIAIAGISMITVIARILKQNVGNVIGKTTGESLSLLVEILGYSIVGVIALTALHVGITSALFGGTVFGLVAGLALQTSLANVFSGLFLIFSRPFEIGDRVTITTWQYGLLAPTYPPKFWSNDFLIPGYTGIVTDISLMYTTIVTDENVIMKIPNNVMIQAAIFVHKEEYRLVRTKYEITKDIDPGELVPELKKRIKELDFVIKEPEIRVLDTTLNTYIIAVDTFCKGTYEEPLEVRSLS
ncbi:MAG: mechanosensitive ion channel family protein [Sulfolobaceae archaeon]